MNSEIEDELKRGNRIELKWNLIKVEKIKEKKRTKEKKGEKRKRFSFK